MAVGGVDSCAGVSPDLQGVSPHYSEREREGERKTCNVNERDEAACVHVWLKEPSLRLFVAASPAPATRRVSPLI